MSFNLQQSFHKLVHYLGSISKHDIEYILDNEKYIVKAPKKIYVSSNIFRKFNCMQCGKCCTVSFWNCYSNNEFNKLIELYDIKKDFDTKEIIINNNKYSVFVNPHEKEGKCIYLNDKNGCSIHKLNPIHCRIPLIKFKYYKTERTYITKEPYGRNWQFGCKAVLNKDLDLKNISEDELNTFNRIKELADEWKIETYINEIVNFISTTQIIKSIEIINKTKSKTIFDFKK